MTDFFYYVGLVVSGLTCLAVAYIAVDLFVRHFVADIETNADMAMARSANNKAAIADAQDRLGRLEQAEYFLRERVRALEEKRKR